MDNELIERKLIEISECVQEQLKLMRTWQDQSIKRIPEGEQRLKKIDDALAAARTSRSTGTGIVIVIIGLITGLALALCFVVIFFTIRGS